MSKSPPRRAQISFLLITFFFRRDHVNTHPPVSPTENAYKTGLTPFFFQLLFIALYSFSLPSKHFPIIFSGQFKTKKNVKTLPEGKKIFFFFFFLSFSLSPDRKKKKKNLLFPPFLSPEMGKPHGKTALKKKFFFGLFFTLPLFVMERNYNLSFFPENPT